MKIGTGYSRCLFFLADGSTCELFTELLGNKQLPNIEKYVLNKGCFKKGVTSFPSTTGPAYTPFLTGCSTGTCDIPGIRWLDRNELDSPFSFKRQRSYVGLESYLMNYDLDKNLKTIFQSFNKPCNILSPIHRGTSFYNNKLSIKQIPLMAYAKTKIGRMDLLEECARREFLKALSEECDFIFYAIHSLDEYSHNENPFSKRVIDCYLKMDELIGISAEKLEEKNELEKTLFIIVSDHGHSPTHTHFDIDTFLEENGYNAFYYPKLYKAYLPFNGSAMVSGNAMAHIYLKNGKTWKECCFEEAIQENHRTMYEKLLIEPSTDLLFTRSKEGNIIVRSKQGRGEIKNHPNNLISYTFTGTDPLDINKNVIPSDYQTLLELTSGTTYPDSFVQMRELFKSKRTGDIIISAAPGYDLRASKWEVPPHHSSHGSLHKNHMNIPFLINHPIKGNFIRTIDIFSTILNLCGKEIPPTNEGKLLI